MQRRRDSEERYRPGKAKPLAIGAALLGVVAVFVLFGSLVQAPAPPLPSPPLPPAKTPVERAARAMPRSELSFIAAIERGRSAAAGDGDRAASRATRANEICKDMPNPHFFVWSGIVEAVSSEPADAAFISIVIAPGTHLTTRSGDEAPAAIDRYVLQSLATLQSGQAVDFSGIFRPGDGDCYRQTVPAADGAMAAPVFVIGLYSISGFNAPEAERSK